MEELQMKKRILSILLVVSLCVSLFACGGPRVPGAHAQRAPARQHPDRDTDGAYPADHVYVELLRQDPGGQRLHRGL